MVSRIKKQSNYIFVHKYHEFEALANKVFFSWFHSKRPSFFICGKRVLAWDEMALGEKRTVEYGVNVEGGAFSLDPADRLGTTFEGCFSI